MSISDMFKFQQQAMKDGTKFDQNAWKTAFDIANTFNKTTDGFTQMQANRLAQHENELTSEARKAYILSEYGAKQAQNQNIIDLAPHAKEAGMTRYQADSTANQLSQYQNKGKLDWGKFSGENLFDENGVMRNPEKLVSLAHQQGLFQHNPFAAEQAVIPYKKYSQDVAKHLAAISPELASKYMAMSGQLPYTVSNDGTVRHFDTDEVIGQAKPEQIPSLVAGVQPQQQKINQSNQVDLRAKQAALDKVYQEALDTDENGIPVLNKEKFAAGMARLSAVYGTDDPELITFSRRVAEQNGWNTQPQATQPQGNSTQGGTQTTVPVGGIPAPVALAPERQATPKLQTAQPPLTPEQKRAELIESLNRHQAQTEYEHSYEYIQQQNKLKEQAIKEVMERNNKIALPYYLAY